MKKKANMFGQNGLRHGSLALQIYGKLGFVFVNCVHGYHLILCFSSNQKPHLHPSALLLSSRSPKNTAQRIRNLCGHHRDPVSEFWRTHVKIRQYNTILCIDMSRLGSVQVNLLDRICL